MLTPEYWPAAVCEKEESCSALSAVDPSAPAGNVCVNGMLYAADDRLARADAERDIPRTCLTAGKPMIFS
jgi:hypothetical protein